MKVFRIPAFFSKVWTKRTWDIPNEENQIFLTFDDGPTESLTDWILSELKKRNIKATFFCVGENAKNLPSQIQKIIQDGHLVGNHTMRHEDGSKTKRKAYFQSIEETSQWIDSKLFRPPYGRMPLTWDKEISQKYKIVMWSWLSFDYDTKVPTKTIIEKAKKIQSGDVLVFHDNLKSQDRLKEILPIILDNLLEMEFVFSPINV